MAQTEPIDLSGHVREFWKIVIYGPPGFGKSVIGAGSKIYRTFVFDCDDGMGSAKAWRVRNALPEGIVKFWTIKKYEDFTAAWSYLAKHWKEFDLVVIDTITELHGIIKRGVMKKTGHETAEQRDWGAVLDQMDFTSEQFKLTPWHVLYLAHEKIEKDMSTQLDVYRPSFRGSWKNEYARHIDVIARYQMWFTNETYRDASDNKQKVRRVIQRWLNCGPDPGIHFKDRSGMLQRFEKPDIDYILAKVLSSQGEGGKDVMKNSGMLQPEDPAEVVATEELQKLEKINSEEEKE